MAVILSEFTIAPWRTGRHIGWWPDTILLSATRVHGTRHTWLELYRRVSSEDRDNELHSELATKVSDLLYEATFSQGNYLRDPDIKALAESLVAVDVMSSDMESLRAPQQVRVVRLAQVGELVLERVSPTDIERFLIQLSLDGNESETYAADAIMRTLFPRASTGVRAAVFKWWLAAGRSGLDAGFLDRLAQAELHPSGSRYWESITELSQVLTERLEFGDELVAALLAVAEDTQLSGKMVGASVWLVGLCDAPDGRLTKVADRALEDRNIEVVYAGLASTRAYQRKGVIASVPKVLDLIKRNEVLSDPEASKLIVDILGEAALDDAQLATIMEACVSGESQQQLWIGTALYSRDIAEGRSILTAIANSESPEAERAARVLGK